MAALPRFARGWSEGCPAGLSGGLPEVFLEVVPRLSGVCLRFIRVLFVLFERWRGLPGFSLKTCRSLFKVLPGVFDDWLGFAPCTGVYRICPFV